jgi:hypothetical protein
MKHQPEYVQLIKYLINEFIYVVLNGPWSYGTDISITT